MEVVFHKPDGSTLIVVWGNTQLPRWGESFQLNGEQYTVDATGWCAETKDGNLDVHYHVELKEPDEISTRPDPNRWPAFPSAPGH
jgi:hypothetical protein